MIVFRAHIDMSGFKGVTIENAGESLYQIAQMIKLDIQNHIKNRMRIDDSGPQKSLKASTIKRKSRPHIIENPGTMAIPAFRVLNQTQARSIKRGASSFTGKRGITKAGTRRLNSQQARYISKEPETPLIDGGNLLFNQSIERISDQEVHIFIGPQRSTIAGYLEDKGFKFWGISPTAVKNIGTYLLRKKLLRRKDAA